MEKRITPGLVLKEIKYGEADRILTVLTPVKGVISVMAKGSLRPKNKNFSACGLFCYSEFALVSGKNMETAVEATLLKSFSSLASDIERVALATYLSEIAVLLSPVGEEAEKLLRLLLNCLYLLSENKIAPQALKAIFELRAMSLCGFLPQLVCCKGCGLYEAEGFAFDPTDGALWCKSCAIQQGKEVNLDIGALYALRHICLVEDKKVFSFALKPQSREKLAGVAEQYLLRQMDRVPKSLEFYKSLLQN